MGGVPTTHTGGRVRKAEYHQNYVEKGHILKKKCRSINAYAWLHLGELNISQGKQNLEGESPLSAVPTATLFCILLLAAYEDSSLVELV
jgi:hypothetical protein